MEIDAIMERAREILGKSTGLKVVKILDAIKVCKCWKLWVEMQAQGSNFMEIYEILLDEDGNPVELGVKLAGKLGFGELEGPTQES